MIRNDILEGTKVFNKSIGVGEFIQWMPTSAFEVHIALIKTVDGKFRVPKTELNELERW